MATFDYTPSWKLENERVLLRPLVLEDVQHLVPIAEKHPNLLQYSPSKIYPLPFLQDYVEKAIQARQALQRYPFIVFDKLKNQYVGSTSFGFINTYDSRIEIGWTWIEKACQGTGLNKNMKFLMLQHVFEVLDFKRVELRTDARNIQSQKAIEKIGGVKEGHFRSHTLMSDGFRRDSVFYGILKEDWPTIVL